MLEYYKHKYYFNAEHSPEADKRPSLDAEKKHSHTFQIELYVGASGADKRPRLDVEKKHSHTFQIVLYVGASEAGGQHLFGDMDQNVREYLSQYEGGYLNDMPPFSGRGTTIEDIGEVFYEDLKKRMKDKGFRLYQLEISENPLCVYIVSNRIMLHTRSDRESRQGIENILAQKKKLLNMMDYEGGT